MSKEMIRAINRLARAVERNNNEKIQRQLARARIDEALKTIEDEAVIHRVTDALKGILPKSYPLSLQVVSPKSYYSQDNFSEYQSNHKQPLLIMNMKELI